MMVLQHRSRREDAAGSIDPSRSDIRRMRARHSLHYVIWLRPALLVMVAALLLISWISPQIIIDLIDYIAFTIATFVTIISIVALRWFEPRRIAAMSSAVDLVIVFVWVVFGTYPDQASILLTWPIIVLAYLWSSRAAVVATVLTSGALWAASMRLDSWHYVEPVPPPVYGLLAAGLLIAFVTSQGRRVERALAVSLARDRVALSLSRRIRMVDNPEDAIIEIARTVGQATGASHSLVLLLEHESDFVTDIASWSHDGAGLDEHHHVDLSSIDTTLRHLVASGHGALIDDNGVRLLVPNDSDTMLAPGSNSIEASLSDLLQQLDSAAGVISPLPMGARSVGAIVLAGDPNIEWSADVLPLLQPLAPQLAAGLAQVVLVRDQHDALVSLERIDRMREHLLVSVSHELRTPLTSTIGFVETLLRDDIELPAQQRHELMEHARDGGLRLLALVEDLLALGSLRADSLDLGPEPIDADRLVIDSLRGIEIPDGRTLRVDVVDDPDVVVDRNRMLQVLSNLIVNAIRHGAGDIAVRCARDGSHVVFDVIDEGSGVAPEHVPELFLPFARFSTRPDSTGLGLAICRSIIEAHGGTVDYDRIAPARTRFRVRLPDRQPSTP